MGPLPGKGNKTSLSVAFGRGQFGGRAKRGLPLMNLVKKDWALPSLRTGVTLALSFSSQSPPSL